jgi:hypothetical protein
MARSRTGIGKVGAVAVVAVMVVVVVAVGGFFASQGPPVTLSPQTAVLSSQTSSTTESTCAAGATVVENLTASGPPCGCVLVVSNSNGTLYLSPNPKAGDDVCIQATLADSAQVVLKVTDSAGSVVFSDQCAATGGAGPSNGDTCLSLWNTANPDLQGKAVEPGVYLLVATGSSGGVQLEANLTLS